MCLLLYHIGWGVSTLFATITTAKDGSGVVGTCTVTVIVPVSYVSIDQNYVTIKKGDSVTLKATVLPTNAGDKSLNWTSSNTAVATVDQDGKVTAKDGGTATIKATAKDGTGKFDTCQVTVIVPVEQIILNKNELAMSSGEYYTLTATIKPANATDKTVTWSSSDLAIAMVDQNGRVLARSGGTVKIKVTANDGFGAYAECVITIGYPRTGWVANMSQTSSLNIRKSPGGSEIAGTAPYAMEVTVTAPAVNGWYPVVTSSGIHGYASADYIVFTKPEIFVPTTSAPTTTPSGVYPRDGWAGNMQQTSSLNIRADASINSAIKTTVSYATKFTVMGAPVNGWYPVKLANGTTGWASADYVVFYQPSITTGTGTPNGTVAGYPKTGWVGNMQDTSSVLNIRESASTTAKIKTTIGYGTQLTVTGPAVNGFYPVRLSNGTTGWASAQYIVWSKPSGGTGGIGGGNDTARPLYAVTLPSKTTSSTLKLTPAPNRTAVPNPLKQGTPVTVKGTVTTTDLLVYVDVVVLRTFDDGTLEWEYGVSVIFGHPLPTVKDLSQWRSYDVGKYGNDIKFGNFTSGNYIFAVVAEEYLGRSGGIIGWDNGVMGSAVTLQKDKFTIPGVTGPTGSTAGYTKGTRSQYGAMGMGYPLESKYKTITSGFGPRTGGFHAGVDFGHQGDYSATKGQGDIPLKAVYSGTVAAVGNDSSRGNHIRIEIDKTDPVSGKKLMVTYMHMKYYSPLTLKDSKGNPTKVSTGTLVGYLGNTGKSTGAHLHIQFSNDGTQGIKDAKMMINPVFFYPNVTFTVPSSSSTWPLYGDIEEKYTK